MVVVTRSSIFGPKLTKLGRRISVELKTLAFLLLLLFPAGILILLAIVPILVYRNGVIFLAKLFRPDLTRILHCGNSWFSCENVTKRAKSNIVVCLVIEGNTFNLETVRKNFVQRVLNKPTEMTVGSINRIQGQTKGQGHGQPEGQGQTGPLLYPELRQFSSRFMGYFFWKNEPNFDIKQHIRHCDFLGKDGFKIPEVCRFGDLQELATRLMSEPWKPEFSPWEYLVIPNYVHDHGDDDPGRRSKGQVAQTALVLRFHHLLGDGKAWTTLCLRDLFQFKEAIYPKEVESKSYHKFNLCRLLMTPIKMPYDFAKNLVESQDSSDPQVNPWHSGQKRSKEYFTAFSSHIPVQQIKDLKNKFGVSFVAVLVTAISGAIRRVMTEAGQNVPETMAMGMILPVPDHPEGLRVHATAINLNWPIGTADPMTRLEKIHREIGRVKGSLFPMGFHYVSKLLGILPHVAARLINNKLTCSGTASLVPGPLIPVTDDGCSCLDMMFLLGLPPGQLGCTITSLVVSGRTRIAVAVDKSLFPSKQGFHKLAGFIDDELGILRGIPAERFFPCSKLNENLNKVETIV